MKTIFFENSKKFKKDKHIYFADWCLEDPKTLNNKSIFNISKNIISNHHRNRQKKLDKDYKFLKKTQKKIFKFLVNNLNKYHNTNYSENYWKIIILPWLINILNIKVLNNY